MKHATTSLSLGLTGRTLAGCKNLRKSGLSTAHLEPRGLPKREGESTLGLVEGGGASLIRGRAASRADYHIGERTAAMNVGRQLNSTTADVRLASSYAPSSLSCSGGEHPRAENATFKKLELARPYERARGSRPGRRLTSGRRLSPLGCPASGLSSGWATARCRAALLTRGLLDAIHQILGQIRGSFLGLIHDALRLARERAIRHECIEASAGPRKQEPACPHPSLPNSLPLGRVSNGGCSLG
jgi:hypothetical protein